MIVGGFDRGLELEELARAMAKHQLDIRRLVIIGASARKLETQLKAHSFTNYDLLTTKDMVEIVNHARACAQQGDSVVLSPGFASFDMFKDFEDRGLQFKEAVNTLS
jgi:UDP-N-acetylmuramoylalanine--D-glutamate ligase